MTGNSNYRRTLPDLLSTAPFAPILLAFASGILAAKFGASATVASIAFAVAIIATTIIAITSRKSIASRLALRQYYWLPALAFFFSAGLTSQIISSPPENTATSKYPFATARVDEITSTTSGERLLITVVCYNSLDGEPIESTHFKAIAYCSDNRFRRGDIIEFRNRFERITAQNPNSEKYVRYLHSKNIAWRISIPSDALQYIDYNPTFTNKAADCRDRIVAFMERTPLESATKGFLIAVMLGDKTSLSEELRTDMSTTGVAHMLALSGLHLGFVVMVLSAILWPFSTLLPRKWRFIMIIVGIWIFTIITGLSVSVVRAAVMTTIFLLSLILQRKRNGVNSLCLAGFIILFFEPTAIADVGFQLSFLTCGAMLAAAAVIRSYDKTMQPYRLQFIHSERAEKHPKTAKLLLAFGRFLRQTASLCLASIAAFAVSWSLTAYYFSNIPLTFLPANLLAGVLLSVLFYLAIIFLPLAAFGIKIPLLTSAIDSIYAMLEKSCRFFAASEQTDSIISLPGIVPYLYLSALLFVVLFFNLRKNRHLYIGICLMAASLVCQITLPATTYPEILSISQEFGKPEFTYSSPLARQTVAYSPGTISTITFKGKTITLVDCDIDTRTVMTECDYLVVSDNTTMQPSELYRIFTPEVIITSATLDSKTKEEYDRLSASHSVKIIDLEETQEPVDIQ